MMEVHEEMVKHWILLGIRNSNLGEVQRLVSYLNLLYPTEFCEKCKQLCHATTQCGNIEGAKRLLQEDVNVTIRTVGKLQTCCIYTEPLLTACELSNTEIVKFLVSLKPQQIVTSRLLQCALLLSAVQGKSQTVSALLNAGADLSGLVTADKQFLDLQEKFHPFILIAACQEGCTGAVDILLNRGVQVDCSRLADNFRPLHIASEMGSADIVGLLLKHNADPNVEANGSITPLHLAAKKGNSEVVQLLLNNAANADARTYENSTPLLLAVEFGHSEICKILLDWGAYMNSKDNYNNSPLYFAVKTKNSLIVKHILDFNPIVDNRIREAVHCIIVQDPIRSKIVDDFIERGFLFQNEDVNDNNLFEAAVKKRYTKIVEWFFDHGVHPSGPKFDSPVLHSAVENEHYEIIERLIDSGWAVNAKDTMGNTPICYLMNNNERGKCYETLRLLLRKGADCKEVSELLHKAVIAEYVDVFKILIRNGADVNALDKNGKTPLHSTVSKKSLFTCDQTHETGANISETKGGEIMKLLLSKNADMNIRTRDGFTAIHLASFIGIAEAVSILLDHGANANSRSENNMLPLHLALHQADLEPVEVCKILVKNGANVNCPNEQGKTPLHLIISKSSLFADHQIINVTSENSIETAGGNIMKLLLHNNADMNIFTSNGFAAIHLAVLYGLGEAIRILLEHGADVNSRSLDNMTPLHLAIFHADSECVEVSKILIKYGVDVNCLDGHGNTPLHLTVSNRSLFTCHNVNETAANLSETAGGMITKLLLSNNADMNIKTSDGFVAIHLASFHGIGEAIRILSDYGANMESRDVNGMTPLHLTLYHAPDIPEFVEVCKILIENGANVHALDNDGMTPLHKIVVSSIYFFDTAEKIIELLVSHGDVNFKTSDWRGLSALHLAVLERRTRLVRVLLNYGAGVDSRSTNDSTPLHDACTQRDEETVSILLTNGANVQARQESGMEPLHLAAAEGCANIVRTLLEFNADIDAPGSSNEIALVCAVRNKRSEVVSILLENGCDIEVRSDHGKTALEIAVDYSVNQNTHVRHEIAPIISSFKNHLIKSKAAGLCVKEHNRQLLSLDFSVSFIEECEVEVSRMKSEMLLGQFTLHDILLKHSYPRHMRNESLVFILHASDYSKYPIYKTLLVSSFRRSAERIRLLDAGRDWLFILMKISNLLNVETFSIPASLQLEDIVSYLNKRDLKNLISCGEYLKRQICG